MKITKNKGMFFIAVFIVLVAYNVIAFVLLFDRHEGFWTGYVFSMLAILLTGCVGLFALGREGMKSKFYGIPLISVAWIYLIVQVSVGFIEMVLPGNFYRYGIVLNVIILAICFIGLIGVNIGKEEVERIDEKVEEKVFFIKLLQVDIEGLIARTADESLKEAIKELADTVRYSDPMSSPHLASIENKIEVKAFTLADSITDIAVAKSLCDELQQLFAERNRKCKILK